MKITFGDQAVEVRPWGGAGSGKVLLMTDSGEMKKTILNQWAEFPEAFEHLADNACVEDMAGMWLIVADARKVGLFFDLEQMKPGCCVCQETDDEDIEDE